MRKRKASGIAVLIGSAVAGYGLIGAAAAQDSGEAGACRVAVMRGQPSGTLEVSRMVFADGNCRCVVSTGSEGQGAILEARIARIAASGACPAAEVIAVPEPLGIDAGGEGEIVSLASLLPPAPPQEGGMIELQEGIPAGP